uniref:Cytochrome c oxidase subunit 3 n=1 Tax=Pteria penguin TaxID=113549 RepID=A0A1P8CZ19_PTEPN|nr:cytochrome c oxidase subunit III [Pteria penguin]
MWVWIKRGYASSFCEGKKQSGRSKFLYDFWCIQYKGDAPYSPFHVPSPSGYAFWMAMSLFGGLVVLVGWMNGVSCKVALGWLCLGMSWTIHMLCADLITESVYQGVQGKKVQCGFRHGFVLFLLSEFFFFFGFGWGFAASAFCPPDAGGKRWPPVGIHTIHWATYPLVNTLLLVTTAFSLTWCHKALECGRLYESFWVLSTVIFQGGVFMYIQVKEFNMASFTIADGIYGSAFFMLVGLHGLHVMVGLASLSYGLIRMLFQHYSTERHAAFRFTIWYWHFVDVVWVGLYAFVYYLKS